MNELQQLLNELITYRDNNGHLYQYLVEDLATITAIKIKEKYMILPNTARNIDFKNNLQELFDGLEIFDEVKNELEKDTKALVIKRFLVSLMQKNIDVQTAFNYLADKNIIIKKTKDVNEHLDALKLANTLAGDRKFSIKEVNYFAGKSPSLNSFGGDNLTSVVNVEFRSLYDVSVSGIHLNSDYSFDLKLRFNKKMSNPFNESATERLSFAKEYSRELKEEMKEYVKQNFIYGAYPIVVDSTEIYMPQKQLTALRKKKGSLINHYIKFNNTYFKSKDWLLYSTVRIKKIPFEELVKIIDTFVYEKVNKIKNSL